MKIGTVLKVSLTNNRSYDEVVDTFFVPEEEMSLFNCGALSVTKAIIVLNKYSSVSDEIIHKFPSLQDFPFSIEDLGMLSLVRYFSNKKVSNLSNEAIEQITKEFDSYTVAQKKALELETILKSQGFNTEAHEITPALMSDGRKIFKLEPYDYR